MARSSTALVPLERIVGAILLMRRQKVMLDANLAELCGVETRVLVQVTECISFIRIREMVAGHADLLKRVGFRTGEDGHQT